MKLYFAPDTCALSPLIVLNELGLPFALVRVDNKSKRTEDGRDFRTISPKGYVPVLELDDGERLTEGPVISQYLADLQPAARLAPANGTFERVRLQEWLNFISTEIHKTFGPLFNADMPDAAKAIFRDKLQQRYDYVDASLSRRDGLLGAGFSAADAYLFTVTRWLGRVDLDVARWPALAAFMERTRARPAVAAAVASEREVRKAA